MSLINIEQFVAGLCAIPESQFGIGMTLVQSSWRVGLLCLVFVVGSGTTPTIGAIAEGWSKHFDGGGSLVHEFTGACLSP